MKSRSAALFVIASLLLVLFTVSVASGQQIGADTVARRGSNTRVEWLPQFAYESATLTVSGPDGVVYQYEFPATVTPYFQTFASDGKLRSNGSYTYELNITPALSEENKAALAAAIDEENRKALVAEFTAAGLLPESTQTVITGYLYIQDGKFLTDELEESQAIVDSGEYSPNSISSPSAVNDFVINDDLIVPFSACIGTDCFNGESFGFDTLRLKENNLRIKFEDTSNSGSFPSNDWQITANDSANGGANKFSIDDITGGRTPFTIEAGAPSHSLYVDDGGRIGFGTSTPVLELHVVDGDTPAVRLQQDGSSGFAAQTWDVAGNEAGFFVRDVTGGSQLPFRILPGADSASLVIDGNNEVGMGAGTNPEAPLHVKRTNGTAGILVEDTTAASYSTPRDLLTLKNSGSTAILFTNTDTGGQWRVNTIASDVFEITKLGTGGGEFKIAADGTVTMGPGASTVFTLSPSGNLTVAGTVNGSSSRALKENLVATDGTILDRVLDLSIYYYNYKADDDSVQHIGPTSEDFAAAFGVGADNKHISPMDMAGVAIAAVQELYRSVESTNFEVRALQTGLVSQQDRIDDLEAQNADLEERLAALEALVLAQMEEDTGD